MSDFVNGAQCQFIQRTRNPDTWRNSGRVGGVGRLSRAQEKEVPADGDETDDS